MPQNLKTASYLLIISCISCLVAVYIEGIALGEQFLEDPFIAGFSVLWVFVIIWLIYDLYKGKDIKLTLILVSFVMLGSIIFEIFEFGFGTAHYFYILELILFCISYFLINSRSSKDWYAKNL